MAIRVDSSDNVRRFVGDKDMAHLPEQRTQIGPQADRQSDARAALSGLDVEPSIIWLAMSDEDRVDWRNGSIDSDALRAFALSLVRSGEYATLAAGSIATNNTTADTLTACVDCAHWIPNPHSGGGIGSCPIDTANRKRITSDNIRLTRIRATVPQQTISEIRGRLQSLERAKAGYRSPSPALLQEINSLSTRLHELTSPLPSLPAPLWPHVLRWCNEFTRIRDK